VGAQLYSHGRAGEELKPATILKPPALPRGATVGIIAPAGPVDEAALQRGVAVLEDADYRVRMGDAVFQHRGLFAGSDANRADDWHAMVRDPEVRAIFCARGGYGSGRLLPLLDATALRRRPKPFVGHSDITFLLGGLLQRAGVVTFHGPMVSQLADAPESAAALLEMLSGGPSPRIEVEQVLREGEAEGVLVGGCLAIVASMCGTDYALETRGRLLFLEDVNEKPYRFDRMLTQLKHAGALDGVAGLVFGETPGCFENEAVTLADVVLDVCGDTSYPIVAGVPSGHGRGLVTLPFGVRARVSARNLTLMDSPVLS